MHLQSSYDALVMAQSKYKDCILSVESIDRNTEEESIMIPLTSSLYVPGKIRKDNFKIDIGTGYFVEKDVDQSKTFFNKRITKLNSDSDKLKELITEKVQIMQSIDSIVREKLTAAAAKEQK